MLRNLAASFPSSGSDANGRLRHQRFLSALFSIVLTASFLLSACSPQIVVAQPTLTNTVTQTPAPRLTNTPIPPTPTTTVTLTATQTPTVTATPTNTVEAETAAKIAAIREAVGDQLEDWVVYHKEIAPFNGKPVDWYEIKLVYTGEEGMVEFQEILDANGVPIGKLWLGFTGQLLIGSELRNLIIAFTFEDYETGNCMWLDQGNDFDCALLTDVFQKPEMTIERQGPNEWNAVPGQVISVFMKGPETEVIQPSMAFYRKYLAGREELFDRLIAEGDPSIGMLFLFSHMHGQCDANNLYRVPHLCYQEEDRIVIPGY